MCFICVTDVTAVLPVPSTVRGASRITCVRTLPSPTVVPMTSSLGMKG